MSDNLAIAAAIAARFATATTPTGQHPLVDCTEQLKTGIGGVPSLFVFPPDEPDIQTAMSTRLTLQTYPVRLYLATVPYDPTDIVKVYGWQFAFQDVILLRSQLGLGGMVAFARLSSSRVADVLYAGVTYLGIDMTVTVKVSEPVQPAA